jgi:hypothetical protein
MDKKNLTNYLENKLCDDIINIIYDYIDKSCLNCNKKLLINTPKYNFLNYKDNIWCDTKNSLSNVDVCNWCYYYVWRPV